jgi:anaerobic selenocysteine-containing dehydrogenase
MNRYERSVHAPERLTRPLRRIGSKGAGHFEPLGWEEALALMTTRLATIRDTWGGEAILPYSYAGTMGLVQRNAGHAFFHALGASRLDRTICTPAKDVGLKAVLGQTPAPSPEAVTSADLVLVWGQNAIATQVHSFQRVRQARQSGAQVWLIDTYDTVTAPHVDRVCHVRPGTDGVLAAGIMHLLHREGLLDEAFLQNHVQGWEELRRELLPAYPSARVSAETGVPEALLVELALAYGRAANPQIQLGNGLSRYGNGAMTCRLIACLPALVGAYAKPSGGLFGGTGTAGALPMARFTREDLQPGPTRLINMNELGRALGPDLDPPVKALVVYHANPASVTPDQNAVRRGLAREDLFTVVHERFLTDTALYADLVLPATTSLEHPDLYRAYGHYALQRAEAVIPPQGEARCNWDLFRELARRLGMTDPLFSLDSNGIIDLLLEGDQPWLAGQRVEAGRAVLLRPPQMGFLTPSGKVELVNGNEPHPLPRPLPRHGDRDPEPLDLVTAPSLFGLNSTFHEREDLPARQLATTLLMHPADASARNIIDGDPVVAFNRQGEAAFSASLTNRVPAGRVVVEGVAWTRHTGGPTVNALTTQRLTDQGGGSTFYDHKVDVRRA